MGDIYFVRHGETDWNKDDRLRGWSPISLNATGRQEAKQAAQELKDQHIIHILAADLPRVIQSAEPISKATKAPVTLDPRLRDFDYGDWTGQPVKTVLPKMIKFFRDEKGTPPGGHEDYSECMKRTRAAFDAILSTARQSGKKNYAVVSNNRVIRMFISYIDDADKWTLQKEDPLGNAGIVRFSLNGDLEGQGRGEGEGRDWGFEIWHGDSGKQLGFKQE